MGFEFIRHKPLYDRILLVLTLDRQKMKERILIGEELQIRFRLQGYTDADVLCDVTRPLGTMLSDFEHDPDGEWNRLGLMPLREALHSNRWKQPGLEQASGDFLAKKYLTYDPVRMYVALRIWNEYLKAREPRDRESACERFMGKMNGFTALFMGNPPLDFDEDTGKPKRLNISTHIYGSAPQEDTRLDLWCPDSKRKMECVAAYSSLYPLIIYYLNRLNDWGLYFRKCKICGKYSLPRASGMSFAVISAVKNSPSRTSVSLMNEPEKTIMTCSTRTSARTGEIKSIRQRKHPAFLLTVWKTCWLLLNPSKKKPCSGNRL